MNDRPEKPWSAACERNRGPILEVLRDVFADRRDVLEIGSGTGQHAVHFAAAMPWLRWQASERAENLPGLTLWLDEAALPNTSAPLTLDVARGPWPDHRYDAVFSANTLHIMAWSEVEQLFAALADRLTDDATVVIYGPFNDDGRPDCQSNAAFDASLKARSSHMGLRDQRAVEALARDIGLEWQQTVRMPANNRCLVWRRSA